MDLDTFKVTLRQIDVVHILVITVTLKPKEQVESGLCHWMLDS